MAVQASMWKRVPFTSGVQVPCDISVSLEEFTRIQQGLLPEGMEDKWFVFYETPYLF